MKMKMTQRTEPKLMADVKLSGTRTLCPHDALLSSGVRTNEEYPETTGPVGLSFQIPLGGQIVPGHPSSR
jgi:hypothetical protein